LFSGSKPPAELLYHRYGGMLFSYIQQFGPSPAEAEHLMVNIFSLLAARIEAAFASSLSIYCWLQIEARKIILEQRQQKQQGVANTYYFSLLQEASQEHQWVFRELFINGRQREELARQIGRDQAYIGDVLRQCMLIIRNKLS